MIIEVTSRDVINWNARTVVEKKVNEIANILKTKIGEIPFMRAVGISDEYIDNPITIINPVLINDVTDAISEYVDGVTVNDVDIVSGETVGDFYIKAVCIFE